MAKRRKAKVRRASTFRRSSFRRKAPRRRKTSGIQASAKDFMFGMAYGAGRAYVNQGVRNVANRLNLPLANVSDEVVMAVVNYGLASGKVPIVKQIPFGKQFGKAGLQAEGVIIGAQLASKFMNRGTANAPSGQLQQTIFA